jgi:dipeptidyl aminopeptidase/acylaminoacyl peptidase
VNKTNKELSDCKKIVEVTAIDIAQYDTTKELKQKKAPTEVDLYRIIYKAGRLRVVGYIAVPKKGKGQPCLIHLRGGGGDFAMLKPKSLLAHLVRYAQAGYVVIAPQYPGVEGGDGEDAYGGVNDLKSIIVIRDILKDLSIADHSRIGVKGHSRGGLMAYMLLREVKWVKAVVIGGAPTDQIRHAKNRAGWRKHQIERWGRSRDETIKRSPLRWVNELPTNVPILIMHGLSDWRVDPLDSIDMSRALLNQKVPYRLILFEGADHFVSEYRGEYVRQTLDWFNRFLVEGEALPNMKPHGD